MTAVDGDLRKRSTVDLVKTLSEQVSMLARQEVALAKAELAEKGKKAGIGAGLLTGGGVAALLALGSLTAFLILLLDLAIPAWLAALIVTVLWGAMAAILALQGRHKMQEVGKPLPEKTVESVKEDLEWVKHPTR
jgi:Putative Actinobacterial Holin-X, holin superfamily III